MKNHIPAGGEVQPDYPGDCCLNYRLFYCIGIYTQEGEFIGWGVETEKSNIILIGMPGSGKSTVGIILAKMMAKRFIDTDILIQNLAKQSLQDIVDQSGHMALRQIEERVLLNIRCKNHIIATGGSAAYSEPAMVHLGGNGIMVFLHADIAALKSRVSNYETRGLAKRPDQTFEDLFEERFALYERYADIKIKASWLTQDQVCAQIISELQYDAQSRYAALDTSG